MQIENLPEVLVTTAVEFANHCETCSTCALPDSPKLCVVGAQLVTTFRRFRLSMEKTPNLDN